MTTSLKRSRCITSKIKPWCYWLLLAWRLLWADRDVWHHLQIRFKVLPSTFLTIDVVTELMMQNSLNINEIIFGFRQLPFFPGINLSTAVRHRIITDPLSNGSRSYIVVSVVDLQCISRKFCCLCCHNIDLTLPTLCSFSGFSGTVDFWISHFFLRICWFLRGKLHSFTVRHIWHLEGVFRKERMVFEINSQLQRM